MKKILFVLTILTLVFFSKENGWAETSQKTYHINIKVKFDLNKPGDTLALTFWPHFAIKLQQLSQVDSNGVCSFDMEQQFPFGTFSVEKFKAHSRNDHNRLIERVYWEAGDDLIVYIKKNAIINDYENCTTFSGKGSTKYTVQYKIRKEQQTIYDEQIIKTKSYDDPFTDTIPDMKPVEDRLISVLNQGRSAVSPFIYDILKTDIQFFSYVPAVEHLKLLLPSKYQKLPQDKREQLILFLKKHVLPLKKMNASQAAVAASSMFQHTYGNLYYAIALLKNNSPDLISTIEEVNSNLKGLQRQSIILSLIKTFGLIRQQKEVELLQKSVKAYPYNIVLNKLLQQTSINLFDYTFIDTSGQNVALRKFKGKFLLIDFWYSGCGGCASYYKNVVSKIEEEFKNESKFAIVSISSDTKFDKWVKSIPLNRYTNKDAINLNTGPLGDKHKFCEEIGQQVFPFALLVDPKGNIIEYNTTEIKHSQKLLSATIRKYLK